MFKVTALILIVVVVLTVVFAEMAREDAGIEFVGFGNENNPGIQLTGLGDNQETSIAFAGDDAYEGDEFIVDTVFSLFDAINTDDKDLIAKLIAHDENYMDVLQKYLGLLQKAQTNDVTFTIERIATESCHGDTCKVKIGIAMSSSNNIKNSNTTHFMDVVRVGPTWKIT